MDIVKPKSFFKDFPKLKKSIQPTSIATAEYNCIAWALGMSDKGVWPNDPFWDWPLLCPNEVTISAFESLFAMFGYKKCENDVFEIGYEKIALYTLGGRPTHATRQLSDGYWTSKCGRNVDIKHKVKDLEGPQYGKVAMYFRRPIQDT